MKNKITMFLMSEKGLKTLENIIEKGYKEVVDLVICAKDKSIQNDYYEEIINLCKQNNIQVINRKEEYEVSSKYAIAISWRWMINLEKHTKLIILHDSLLPKYRGFAPLVNALINGEKNIGVTAIFASGKYDEGDIILQKQKEIKHPIKIKKAIELITVLYTDIILEILKTLSKVNKLEAKPQDAKLATYSLWRDEKDYFINWKWEANKIARFVDAVGFPYNGAKAFCNGEEIIINEIEVLEDLNIENRDEGKVIFFEEKKPVIVCGKGLIIIKDAKYISNQESVLPLKKFRTRFN